MNAPRLALLLCMGCVAAHSEGMLPHAVQVGSVDFEITRVYYAETPDHGVMLDYRFGNRSDRGTPVDLGAFQVNIDGHMASLYDPHLEIHRLRLGPLGQGHERIVYLSNAPGPPMSVCVTLNGRCIEVGP
jgi:hypothetical protein